MLNKAQRSGPPGYTPGTAKGGSKKGAKRISWKRGVGAWYKIIVQRKMENGSIPVFRSRVFGGYTSLEPMLLFMEKHHPEFYELLRTSRGDIRTREEMLGVLYDRGHKGFYANDKEKNITGRPRISPEHYSQSAKLCGLVEEAERELGCLLHLGKKTT